MLTAIILVSIVCLTTVVMAILIVPGLNSGRDMAARDRDFALARLHNARVDLMHVENLERRSAMRRRDNVESRIEEARKARQRDAVAEEVRR